MQKRDQQNGLQKYRLPSLTATTKRIKRKVQSISEQMFRASRTSRRQSWSREAPASWTPANESIQIELMKKQRIVSEPRIVGSALGLAMFSDII